MRRGSNVVETVSPSIYPLKMVLGEMRVRRKTVVQVDLDESGNDLGGDGWIDEMW